MAKIVFKAWSAISHYNATFALAKSLRDAGHEVIYAGVEELRSCAESQGFSFAVHEEKGLFNPFLGRPARAARTNRWQDAKHVVRSLLRRHSQLQTDIASTAFLTLADQLQPDAIILDAHYTALALRLLARRTRFAVFSTKVCLDRFSGLPPIQSEMVPDHRWRTRLCADFAWHRLFARRHFRSLLRTGRLFNSQAISRAADRPESDFEIQRSLFTGIRCVPELLLSPREFDFPHAPKPHQRYVSGLPDLERNEANYDLAFQKRFAPLQRARTEGQPLVYCSLGTIAWRYRGAVEFLQRLIKAATGQRWNLLLATGAEINPHAFEPLPANVTVLQRVPQVGVLREADVMVTHGGMNSIKECIALAVPMLVYPGGADIDQGGNSARVLYHGIGLRGRMRRDSVAKIQAKINRLLGEPQFRRNIQHMAAEIACSDAQQCAAEIVEKALSLHPSYAYATSS